MNYIMLIHWILMYVYSSETRIINLQLKSYEDFNFSIYNNPAIGFWMHANIHPSKPDASDGSVRFGEYAGRN